MPLAALSAQCNILLGTAAQCCLFGCDFQPQSMPLFLYIIQSASEHVFATVIGHPSGCQRHGVQFLTMSCAPP